MNIQMRYFARLREQFGRAEEAIDLPAGVDTVAALIETLTTRGGAWAEELAPGRVFRVAVDQELADPDCALHDGAEVALLPPVTGG